MTTSNDLDTVSNSWDEHSPSEHGGSPSQPGIQVAQASQPSAADPVPVDVGSGAPVQPAAPAAANAAAAPHEYVADASNIVRLPASVSIDNIKVDGHNLLLQQADGSVIVIKDGALNVPTFIIGDVEVPRVALLAALEASHVDVAFGADGSMSAGPGGAPDSAGADFTVPPGGIGDGFDLSALLPPTDLAFGQTERRELFLPNAKPEFGDVTVHVSEEGLPGANPDGDPGSPFDQTNLTVINGSFGATDPNGDPLTYSLGVPATALTSHGADVVWELIDSTHLVGKVGADVVVSVTITDASAGTYQIVLAGPLDHPLAGFEDDLSIVVPVTVQDPFGGSATANMTVVVEDDSPTLTVGSTAGSSAVLDETAAGSPAGFPIGVTSANPIISVVSSFGADGAAAGGGIAYALGLTGNVASLDSGLKTAIGDFAITLQQTNATTVTGTYQNGGTQTAFTIVINGDGTLTVTQFAPLEHTVDGSSAAAHDDLLTLSGKIIASVTVTDFDGDSTFGGAQIGGAIQFHDDGPSVTAVANAGVGVSLDETQASSIAAAIDTGLIVKGEDLDVSGNGAITAGTSSGALVNVTALFGGDGPAAGSATVYQLSVTNAVSGLSVTDGSPISLQTLASGVVVGVVQGGAFNGQAAFALSIDPVTGKVSVEQYLSLDHPNASNPDDIVTLANGSLAVKVTITDSDGDTASANADVSGQISFHDDGPSVTAAAASGAAVSLDETATTSDPALIATPGITKGDDLDVGGTGAIAHGTSSSAFVNITALFGADGPAVSGSTVYQLVATSSVSGLTVTDGSPIDLQTLPNGVVVGVVNGGAFNGLAAFALSIDPATGKVSVEQYLSLHHPDTTNPDDTVALSTGSLAVTVTVTDGDGDQASATADVSGQVTFDDDGPSLTISQPNGALNGLFLDGFIPNGNAWGAGSGTTTGPAGAWTVAASPYEGAGSVELQKVGDGYRGADSPTNSVMVDLEASPGNVEISQTIHGLTAGEYRISFEIGAASDPGFAGSAKLEVIWNGVSVGTYDPTSSVMQTIALNVTATAGDNSLTFREIGEAGDNTGTFLANIKVGDIIVIDETAGVDADSDDTINPAVSALFAGVNAGTDPDMPLPQYAQGSGGVVNAAALFGADGPATSNSLVYALSLANNTGVDSGLKTTDGHAISLFTDGSGRVIGVYDADGNGITADDKVAFALHIDAGTGQVAVAQFVSLQHPDTTSNDEGISLGAGLVSVTVTATDGDGDHVTQSADISQTVVFEDDGPTALTDHAAPVTIDEDDIASLLSQGTSPYDGSADGSNTEFPLGAAIASGSLSGLVDFGADGPAAGGGFGFSGTAAADMTAIGLSSKGVQLSWVVQGNTLIGFVDSNNNGNYNLLGDRTVMTVTLNASSGAFAVRQFDQLDHVAPPAGTSDQNTALQTHLGTGSVAGIDLGSVFQAKDGDGDTVKLTGKATITVVDDVPQVFITATGASVVHDETAGLQNDDTSSASVANQFAALGSASLGYARDNQPVVLFGSLLGTDEPRAVVLSLSIAAAGTDSGLKTTDGHEISLFKEGNLIVGRVDNADGTPNATGNVAFAVSVDQTGHISTAQYLSLQHPLAGDGSGGSYDEPVNLSDKINAVVTVTDFDGDTVSQSLAIGAKIVFEDDGPSLTVGANDGAAGLLSVELDETVGADRYNGGESEDAGGNANTDDAGPGLAQVNTAVTGGLTNLFSIGGSYGSDGPGTVTGTLSFTGIPAGGLATNLTATDGGAITLFLEGGVIVGRDTQLNQVLTIAITGAPGAEQLQTTLFEALNHGADGNKFDSELNLALTNGGQVQLQYEVTRQDGDGDTITEKATVDLIDGKGSAFSFDDDGPQAIGTAQVTANVDEDGLQNSQSTGNADNPQPDGEVTGTNSAVAIGAAGTLNAIVDFGSDGPNATSAFGLVTQTTPSDSGFDSKGGNVLIVSDGTTLTGYVDLGAGAGYQAGTDRPVFTLTVGADGSYVFTLIDQIDHPTLNTLPGDDTENTLANGGIDLSSFVVAKDGDGDTIGLAAGTFKVQVLDDVPQIVARDAGTTTTTTTETIVYTLQAGNTDIRGMDGAGDHDIKLTGIDINEGDNSVNTTGTKIGVGDGQIIDGYETHPHLTGPEIVTMDFVNNLVITPNNPNPPSVTDSGSYDVASVKFTIDVAEAKGVEAAVMFIGAKDGGTFEPFTVNINGVLTAGTAVFEGGVQVGYAFAGVPDGATVEVVGSTPFDQLKVGNYDSFKFDSDNNGVTDTTLTGGNPFKIFGIEAKVTTVTTQTEVFRVSHDESAGVNNAADPNPADDTALPPPALVDEPGALGYAKSSASALGLFNASVGADDDATFSFAVTDANGNPLVNVDSGLKTLDGSAIMLSTNADGVLVGSANGVDVFKVYVDPTGAVWIGQYQPIAHNVDGSSTAAFDDIATVAADLHVKATITDFDGDSSTAVSDVALSIEFQDDGPVAVNDQDSVTEDGPVTADGNVITGVGGADANATDGQADHPGSDGLGSIAWDGAVANHVAGTYGQLTVGADGSYTYVLYTQAQNPAGYAAVQALDVGQTLAESFDYAVADGDGDTALASLTITINGTNDVPQIVVDQGNPAGAHDQVYEAGLPAGSAAGNGSTVATGTFTVSDPDGLDDVQSVTIGGTTVAIGSLNGSSFIGAHGTLLITGYNPATGVADYQYTLTSPTTDGPGIESETFSLTVSDGTSSSAPAAIVIDIVDDVPNAVNDTNSISEDAVAPVNGNVLTNDLHANNQPGADTPTSFVSWDGSTTGAHGTFVPNGDGTYTYTLNNADPAVQALDAGQTLTETFNYTMKDADGDIDTATLTITINGTNDVPQIVVDQGNPAGAHDQVYEAGLSAGSAAGNGSTVATGTFTVSDPDGLDDVQSVTIGGTTVAIGSLNGSSFIGAHGTLLITGYNPATGVANYQYTLTSPTTDGPGIESETFSLTVSDGTSSSAPAAIVIDIVDDVPNAVNDTNSISEDAVAPVNGNVLTNDLHANNQPGADTPTSFVSWDGSTTGAHGTFVPNGDGTYTYTLNNADPAVQALDAGQTLIETFNYTMKDADGDIDTATLTITINGTNDVPQIVVDQGNPAGAHDQVYEAGLPAGSAAGNGSTVATGTFTVSDPDGLDDVQSVTIGGTTVAIGSLNGSSFIGAHGTLLITPATTRQPALPTTSTH